MDRKQHLEFVLEQIEKHKNSIEYLERLVISEYKLEGGNSIDHPPFTYGNDLRETITEQLKNYKDKIKNYPNKDSSSEFDWFLNRFIKDVESELNRL